MADSNETNKRAEELLAKIDDAMERLDVTGDRTTLSELEQQAAEPDFWSNSEAATTTTKELAALKKHIDSWQSLHDEVADLIELLQLDDASGAGELTDHLVRLEQSFGERELELKLSGPYDKHSAILSIYAGTGGTDAQDWAAMLE